MKNNPPEMFKQGMNVLMLIDRGVNNSNKGSRRWINKIIVSDEKEWDEAAQKLIELQTHLDDPDIRLYSSVNPRSLQKGIRAFKHRQLDLFEEAEVNFYRRINDSFCSCLMQPENRSGSYFLIDVDTKDATEVCAFLIMNHDIKMHYSYQTPNGWHYITDPFNTGLCSDAKTFEVKKDALLLINWIDK